MIFDNRPASAITAADIQGLLDDQVPEGQPLDYKLVLPAPRNPQTAEEFRLDVAAFANAEGGYLVFGVAEVARRPTGFPGLAGLDAEGEARRLNAILATDLEPRVAGVTIAAVPLPGGDPALVVHVPRSWQRPHWVRAHQLREWRRFVARRDADKATLDYRETRQLFLGTADLTDRVRQFRAERLARLLAEETPVPVLPHPKVVLHVVPFDAFEAGARLAAPLLGSEAYRDALAPPGSQSWSRRPNFDGYLAFERSSGDSGRAERYLQVLRDGCLEAVDAWLLRPRPQTESGSGIPERVLADNLIDAVGRYLPFLQTVGITPPYAILLSLLGVRGYTLRNGDYLLGIEQQPLERDEYLFPPIEAEGSVGDPARLLRPAFDALWNAVGRAQSPHYSKETGNWAPRW